MICICPANPKFDGLFIRMDVHENPEENLTTAVFELPGVRNEDLNIRLHRNRLTISGESNCDLDREERGFFVRERNRGRYSRTLSLPHNIQVS